jgi:hypothetical protein
MNSSLDLCPNARGCANRRWLASEGALARRLDTTMWRRSADGPRFADRQHSLSTAMGALNSHVLRDTGIAGFARQQEDSEPWALEVRSHSPTSLVGELIRQSPKLPSATRAGSSKSESEGIRLSVEY